MSLIVAERTESAAPASVTVATVSGGPVNGLIGSVSVRVAKDDRYLDFADNTFKTVGWTTKSVALTEVAAGVYTRAIDVNAMVVPANVRHLVFEYTLGALFAADDVVVLDRIYNIEPNFTSTDRDVLYAINTRTVDILIDTSALEGDVTLLRKHATNRLEVDFTRQQLVLYDDDGVTVLQRWVLSTDDGSAVIPQTGVQTKRSGPA